MNRFQHVDFSDGTFTSLVQVYIGKWHLSHTSPDQHDALEPYGFSGWRGPEPHGANPKNSGLARDPEYVAQAVEWLQKRRAAHAEQVAAAAAAAATTDAAAATSSATAAQAAGSAPPSPLPPPPLKPFLLVVCLVNPHDIVFWPSWWVPQLAVLATSAAMAAGGASWVLRRAVTTAAGHNNRGSGSSIGGSIMGGGSGSGGSSRPSAQALALAAAVVAAAAAVAWKGLKLVSLKCDEIEDPGPGPSDFDCPDTSSPAPHAHSSDAQDAVSELAKEEGDSLDVGGGLTSALLGESVRASSSSKVEGSTHQSRQPFPPPRRLREATVISQYRQQYPTAYGPAWIIRRVYEWRARSYRLTYATLLRRADHHLGQLLDALNETLAATQELATTGVCFTADHGELLGAHGGLHQKWYGAYDEALRVPLLLKVPWLKPRSAPRKEVYVVAEASTEKGSSSSGGPGAAHDSEPPEPTTVGRSRPTSHLDLMPTLLQIAGIDSSQGGAKEEQGLKQLPGRNLLAEYRDREENEEEEEEEVKTTSDDDEETYFVTFDHVLDGASKHGSAGRRYPFMGYFYRMQYTGLTTPETAVEALVARLPGHTAAAAAASSTMAPKTAEAYAPLRRSPQATKTTWKVVRSFNPARQDSEGHLALFCLDNDPAERWNLAGPSASPGSSLNTVEMEMRQRLAAARVRHGGPCDLGVETKWAK